MKQTSLIFRCILSVLSILLSASVCTSQVISTFAGNGIHGDSGDGGQAIDAAIGAPGSVAIDKVGNAYFATTNYKIKKVDASGIITTIAGNGISGYSGDGGPATNAMIRYVRGIAIDTFGIIYISDGYYNCIRSIDTSGYIHIFAGMCDPFHTGYSGDGGPATAANLFYPDGVAADRLGNIYISDYYNNVVRKVHGGIITTFAGTGTGGHSGDGGPATAAQLRKPSAIAADSLGNVYICDSMCYVRKVNTAGNITTIVGTIYGFGGDGGPATAAKFRSGNGLATDNYGNLYLSDHGNSRIRIINTSGIINTYAGTGVDGYNGDGIPANTAQLNNIGNVAIDSRGNLYISDFENFRVRKVTAPTGVKEMKEKTKQLSIYPNPANDNVTVVTKKAGLLLISDLYGRVLMKSKIDAGKNKIMLPSALPQGIYPCRFIDEETNSTEEINLEIRR